MTTKKSKSKREGSRDRVTHSITLARRALWELEEALRKSPNNRAWFDGKLGNPDICPAFLDRIRDAHQRLSLINEMLQDGLHAPQLRQALGRADYLAEWFADPKVVAILADPLKRPFALALLKPENLFAKPSLFDRLLASPWPRGSAQSKSG